MTKKKENDPIEEAVEEIIESEKEPNAKEWTNESLGIVSAALKGKNVDVKGKDYVMVNNRVKAFREACPSGLISTEIVPELTGNGIVTMKTTIADGNSVILATGMAQEKESSSYINKTSYIENCETSAVGRALGFLGVGIDASMASAEEVANAIKNQDQGKPQAKYKMKETIREKILKYCNEKHLDLEEISQDFGLTKESTDKEREEAFKKIKERFGE